MTYLDARRKRCVRGKPRHVCERACVMCDTLATAVGHTTGEVRR